MQPLGRHVCTQSDYASSAGDTSYTDVACSDGKKVEAKVRHDLHRGIGAAVEHHQRVNRFALQ
jgi:hypothetical protein